MILSENPYIEIINDDCMNIMDTYSSGTFDLAIVDPPYGINADVLQNRTAKSRIKANGKSKAGRGWMLYKETNWDNKIPDEIYWNELFRISKNQIVFGGNYFTEFLSPSKGWVVWDKCQRNFSLADCELIWTSFDKSARIFKMSRGKSLVDNNNTGNRFHPTQKPVMLYEWILKNYGIKCKTIIDTHLGSGSLAIAAYKNNINFVGIEIDQHYYEMSVKRIERFMNKHINPLFV